MAISINLENVKKALTNFSNTLFPSFYDYLNNVNAKFGTLNSYWSGNRYVETMKAWNSCVPELNKYLQVLVRSSEVLNTVLANYTAADGKKISLNPASLVTLSIQQPNNKEGMTTFDNAKLKADLTDIKKNLNRAIETSNNMNNVISQSDWKDSNGAIDTSKQDVKTALTKISANLGTVLSEINASLTAIEQGFSDAKSSYK